MKDVMRVMDPIIHDLKEGSLVRKFPSTYLRNGERANNSHLLEDTEKDGMQLSSSYLDDYSANGSKEADTIRR